MQGSSIYEDRVVCKESDVLSLLPKDYQEEGLAIRFLGTHWTIMELDNDVLKSVRGSDDDLEGFCDYDNEIVYVDWDLTPHRKGVCVVHELLHAVIDHAGLEDEQKLVFKDSDDLIRRLEHGIYDLVNSFPKKYKMRFQP